MQENLKANQLIDELTRENIALKDRLRKAKEK